MIDLKEVRRIAELAHIEFDQAGLEQMARELSKILDYIDQLKEVPLQEAAAVPAGSTPMRDDVVSPSVPIAEVEQNAPAFAAGFFVVPRVLEGGPPFAGGTPANSARDARTPMERLNAFLYLNPEPGEGRFPIAVKDNIVTRDAPTTCGSRILSKFRSPFDATAVARLRDAGAIIVGKTNLDEFAMGSSTEHSAFGVTRNPWDLDRVAGGSSGGSAAAVAARLVPVALGSETGGSVRQPAAFCGVLGLKPTYGRVSRSGLVAFASSLDQIGVLATNARDCAMVLGIIAGADAMDSTSSSEPVGDYTAELDGGVKGWRFGVVTDAVDQISGELRDNFESSLEEIRRGGGVVEPVSIPTIRYAIAIYYIVANAEASANLARFDGVRYGHRSAKKGSLRDLYFASRSEGFGAEVKRRIMLGTFALSAGYYEAYYGRAQKIRALLSAGFDEAFSRFDFLLTPTTPSPAFRIGEKTDDPLSMYLSDIFTAPANLVGIPAIAIPSGFTAERLPLSLQVMGPHFSESRLLRVAQYFESRTDHSSTVPTGVL